MRLLQTLSIIALLTLYMSGAMAATCSKAGELSWDGAALQPHWCDGASYNDTLGKVAGVSACTNLTGGKTGMIKAVQGTLCYYDGSNWYSGFDASRGDNGGCTNPTYPANTLNYNSSTNLFNICANGSWQILSNQGAGGGDPPPACGTNTPYSCASGTPVDQADNGNGTYTWYCENASGQRTKRACTCSDTGSGGCA